MRFSPDINNLYHLKANYPTVLLNGRQYCSEVDDPPQLAQSRLNTFTAWSFSPHDNNWDALKLTESQESPHFLWLDLLEHMLEKVFPFEVNFVCDGSFPVFIVQQTHQTEAKSV